MTDDVTDFATAFKTFIETMSLQLALDAVLAGAELFGYRTRYMSHVTLGIAAQPR